MKIILDEKRKYDLLVVLFFVSIHLDYIVKSGMTLPLRYAVAVACCALPLLKGNVRLSGTAVLFGISCVLTGVLNIFIIGNGTWMKLIYTVISFGIAFFFVSDQVTPRGFLAATYVNSAMIALLFAAKGIGSKIYASASVNYVSIFLLLSVTLYYTLCEKKGEKLRVFPALLVFILCVAATGRGGILAGGIILIAVILSALRRSRSKAVRSLLVLCIVLLVFLLLLLLAEGTMLSQLFGRFEKLGMSDHGRSRIWKQYMIMTVQEPVFIWLGTPFRKVPILIAYQNNLHNSFLNIHAFNGLVTAAFVLVLMIRGIARGILKRQWIFLICFLAISMRGFTDQMFWGTIGTPVLLFYLFFRPGARTLSAGGPEQCRDELTEGS